MAAGDTTSQYVDPLAGKQTGTESSLSSWAGPYVTEMLGRGQALASMPYQAYTGPLTAAPSALQNQAFAGLANLTLPTGAQTTFTPGSFTDPGTSSLYMSPFINTALEPQIAEARRQADISRVNQAGRLTKAGAYGGGRQAIMESELDRNLLRNMADITGKGYQTAYEQAASQFNTEQARQQAAAGQAQQYGLAALDAQRQAGATQRDIEQQGITADLNQFQEERDYPYKQVQYMQSLLQGLPTSTQSYSYQPSSTLSNVLGGAGGILGLLNSGGSDALNQILGWFTSGSAPSTTANTPNYITPSSTPYTGNTGTTVNTGAGTIDLLGSSNLTTGNGPNYNITAPGG